MVSIWDLMLSLRHETSLRGIQVFSAFTDLSVTRSQMRYLCVCENVILWCSLDAILLLNYVCRDIYRY